MAIKHLTKHLGSVLATTESAADRGVRRVLAELLTVLARGDKVEIGKLGEFHSRKSQSIDGKTRLKIVFEGAIPAVPPPADSPFLALQPFEMAEEMLVAKAARKTYPERWRHLDTKDTWHVRAKQAAAYIRPGDTVADIGCGDMILEPVLPEGCQYLPFDVVKRDKRTTIIDLNSGDPLPEFQADVICCLGLIEYLFEPKRALLALRAHGPRLIVSHNAMDAVGAKGKGRPVGWVTNLTVTELEQVFKELALRVIEKAMTRNERQYLYLLERAD